MDKGRGLFTKTFLSRPFIFSLIYFVLASLLFYLINHLTAKISFFSSWQIIALTFYTFILISGFLLFLFLNYQQKTETEKQKAEEKFYKIFHSNLIPIIITRLSDNILVDVNDAFCKEVGYSREEILNMGTLNLGIWVNTSDRSRVLEIIKTKGYIRGERIEYRMKDGTIGFALLSGEVITLSNIPYFLLISYEINSLVQYEKTLEENQAILEGILDASLDVIALVDLEGKFILANNKLGKRWRIPNNELVGTSAKKVLHEDIFNSRMEIIRKAVRENCQQHFIDTHDGRWFENTISPIKAKDSKIEKVAMFSREITDRKQAEDALKKSEAELRAIFATMKDIIIVYNKEGRYIKIAPTNPELLYGVAIDITGKTIYDLFEPEKADFFLASIQKSLGKKETLHIEYDLLIRGKLFWFECAITPIDDENVLWVARDISERKIAEEKLIDSEKRYQTLANISPVGIFKTDATGFTTYVNPRWSEISEIKFNDALGNEWLNGVHPEDRKRILNGWQSATDQHSTSDAEYRFVHGDGSIRWVIGQATPEIDEDGTILGYVGTITDITERKKAELELQKTQENYRALSAYLQKVREEERANLAREMHDELGQILTSVKLNLSFMKHQHTKSKIETDAGLLDKDIVSVTEQVDLAINSVRRLITELRPELLDKLGLVQALEWFIDEFEKSTRIESHFDCEFEDLAIDKNSQLAIFRITQESLNNITKHAAATKVNIFFGLEENRIVLEISDNGKGFSSSNKENNHSYGLLGMKERAAFIGGNLEINSILNEGTKVKLTLSR